MARTRALRALFRYCYYLPARAVHMPYFIIRRDKSRLLELLLRASAASGDTIIDITAAIIARH